MTKKKNRGRVEEPVLRPFTDEEWRRARGPAAGYRNWRGETLAFGAGIELGREQIEQRQRTACTVCGDPQEWYRLEPGTGRCTKCQP